MYRAAVSGLMATGALCGALAGPAMATPYSGLYVFGDSLSEVGNVSLSTHHLLPGSPYFDGRFSNGPNWVDDFSAGQGLGPVTPSLAGGNDYAYGGAVTGPAVPGATPLVPSVLQQVGQFSAASAGVAPSSALYAVWIGSNDVLNALDDLADNSLTVAQAAKDVALAAATEAVAVNRLAKMGAESFLVPFVPDLGKTPDVTDISGLSPIASLLSREYNAALVASMNVLTAGDEISVTYLNTFTLLDSAVDDPAAYGFTNVTDRCYVGPLIGGGSTCADPDGYLFWDGQHPTAAADSLVAQAALAAVPEPSSLAIMGSAVLAILGLCAWRGTGALRRPG